MSPAPHVRLPLQIGTSSIWSLARASASLFAGPTLSLLIVAAMFAGRVPVWLGVGLAAGGLLLFPFALAHLRYAVRERPSDVLLSADGLRIEGGRYHGLVIAWTEIDREGCVLTTTQETRQTLASIGANVVLTALAVAFESAPDDIARGKVEVQRLAVARRNAPPIVVAEAERPIEKESLRALLDSIHADHWYGPADAAAPPATTAAASASGQTIVACAACGAPAAPDDAASVTCLYCGADVPVTEEVRAGVRDSRTIGRERRLSNRLVTRLVAQPGATRVGTLVALASGPMMLAWPAALWMTFGGWRGPFSLSILGSFPLTFLARPTAFALTTVLAFFFLLRSRLSDRFALRLLTLGFAARAPERPGAPYTCRRCGAPLAEARDTVLAPCVYCGTDNVIGVDLGRRATAETAQAQTLAEALHRRGRERRLWSALTVAAVVLLAGDLWFLSGGRWPAALHLSFDRTHVVASGLIQPVALAVGDGVYWIDLGGAVGQGRIMRMARTGGVPITLAAQQTRPQSLAVDDRYVYWTDSEERVIRRMPREGGAVTVIVTITGSTRPDAIALADGRLYWTTLGSPTEDGAILRAALDGTAPERVVDRLDAAARIAVSFGVLYWTNDAVMWTPTGGSTDVFMPSEHRAVAVAADETYVYWSEDDGRILRGTKSHAPADRPRVVARGQAEALGIAVDATDVYWITANTIVRRSK